MALTKIETDGIKDDAVTSGKIPANAVGSSELADNAVDTNAIQDDAVTEDKLANSINTAIAANTAKTSNATHTGDVTGSTSLTIANDAVTTIKIANSAVSNNKLQDNSIVSGKLADSGVNSGSYGSATAIPAITVNNKGQITAASTNNVSIPAGTTINNNADNRVITGSGSANTLEGEAKLTFDGDIFSAKNSSNTSGIDFNVSGSNPRIDFNAGSVASSGIIKSEESGSGAIMEFHNKNSSGSEQQVITLTVDRNLQINDGNLVVASGHGIDFSASSNESGSSTELLDDYERGTFTGYWTFAPTNATSVTYTYQGGMYVKVGRLVYFVLHLWTSSKGSLSSGSGWCQIGGLPFAVDAEGGFASIAYYDNFGSFNPSIARPTAAEQIYIAQHNNGGYSQDLQHSHMNNSTRMHIGGCYATTS